MFWLSNASISYASIIDNFLPNLYLAILCMCTNYYTTLMLYCTELLMVGKHLMTWKKFLCMRRHFGRHKRFASEEWPYMPTQLLINLLFLCTCIFEYWNSQMIIAVFWSLVYFFHVEDCLRMILNDPISFITLSSFSSVSRCNEKTPSNDISLLHTPTTHEFF